MGGFFTKLFSKLSGKKQLKIIIIGLDNSGKTTILNKLHLNEVKETVPSTSHSYLHSHWIQYGNCRVQKPQIPSVGSRRTELNQVTKQSIKLDNTGRCITLLQMLFYTQLTVKINKDLPKLPNSSPKFQTNKYQKEFLCWSWPTNKIFQTLPPKRILAKYWVNISTKYDIGLSKIKNRDWSIYKCSAVTGLGLNESMDWLVQKLVAKS